MFYFVWTRMPFFIGCVEKATFYDDHDECVYHLLVWNGTVDVLDVHHANIYLGDQFFETVCWCPLGMHYELVVSAVLLISSLLFFHEEVKKIEERCIWVT